MLLSSLRHGDHDALDGTENGARESRRRHRVPGYCGGRSPMMASSTGRARANGVV